MKTLLTILVLAGAALAQQITVAPNPNNVKPLTLAAALAIEPTLKQPIDITLGPGVYVVPATINLPDDGFCANIHGAGQSLTYLRATGAIVATLLAKGVNSVPVSCLIRDLTIDVQGQAVSCMELQRGKGWSLEHLTCTGSTSTTEAIGLGNAKKDSEWWESDVDDVYIQTTAPYGLHLYNGATDSGSYRNIRVNGATMAAVKNEGAANLIIGLHPYGSPKYCVEDYGRNTYVGMECDTYTVAPFNWLGTAAVNSKAVATSEVQVGSFLFMADYPVALPAYPSSCTLAMPNTTIANSLLNGNVTLTDCKP